jgi:molybdenum cofactor cytidylyltransferase
MTGIWAIILAAGESRRMGSPKMLLPFKESTMLGNVIGNVLASEIEQTMVVLGAHKDKVLDIVQLYPVSYCVNDNYKEGMLSSVQCGFRNLPSDFEAVLVFQGDQPLIAATLINRVIEAYRSSGKGIVIPVFGKKRGHPLLICRKYIDEVEKIDAGEGLRSLAHQFSDDVLEVETDQPGILRDIDTYDEYKREINQIL